MRKFLAQLKSKFGGDSYDELESEQSYLELDTESQETKAKTLVRPFMLEDFEDVKPVIDSLREGHTIALVNIKALRDRDLVELKRAISKLKKTTDALDGEIAGFGEDYIVVTPAFASIYRSKEMKKVEEHDGE